MTDDVHQFDGPRGDAHMDLTILSQPRYLCVVRAAVEAAARQLGLAREEADAVVIAVDEAVSNVIRHGYTMAQNRPIRVLMSPGRLNGHTGVQIDVEDACAQVRPEDIRSRSPLAQTLDDIDNADARRRAAAASTPGGLGLHLIQRAMDRVEIARRDDDRGIRLRMFKAARPPSTGADHWAASDAIRDREGAEP